MSKFNPFEILGVEETATKAEIRSAYRKKSKEVHPDSGNNQDSDEFLALKRAHDILQDDMVRQFFVVTGSFDIDRKQIEAASLTILEKNLQSLVDALSTDFSGGEFDFPVAMVSMLEQQQQAMGERIDGLTRKIEVLRKLSEKSHKRTEGVNVYRLIIARKTVALTKEVNDLYLSVFASDLAMAEAKTFVEVNENVFRGDLW